MKDSNQKILESGVDECWLQEMNELDKHEERKRVLSKSSVEGRIQSLSLWENKEKLEKKRLGLDLTKKVLQGEKKGIEMIVKKIKADEVFEDCQKT